MKRSNSSRGNLLTWGKMTHISCSSWMQTFVLLFLCLGAQVSGAPLDKEEGMTQERQSELSSHHHPQPQHRHNMNKMNVKLITDSRGEEDEGGPTLQQQGEISLPKLRAVGLLLEKYRQIEAADKERAIEEELEQEQSEIQESGLRSRQRVNSENFNGKLARALWSQDYERRASEICGTSASLQCGKRILNFIEDEEKDLSVHMKCDLREDFLKCIDTEKKNCLELAESSILPQLPPKEMIKVEQSKLWKVLWAAGGCVLSN